MRKYQKILGFIVIGFAMIGTGLHTNVIKLPFERLVEASLPEGFGNDRGFVGLSHNIFGSSAFRVGNSQLQNEYTPIFIGSPCLFCV